MITVRILENRNYHSLKLHFLQEALLETNEKGIVVMGTEANKTSLMDLELYDKEVDKAEPNDLVIIVDAKDPIIIDEIIERAENRLSQRLKDDARVQSKPQKIPLRRRPYFTKGESRSPFFLRSFTGQRKMGRIHSAFRSSFNVMFDDQLLNFSTVGMSIAPHGCILNSDKIDRVLTSGKTNDLVKMENGRFTFYTRGDIVELDLSSLEETNLSIPSLTMSKQKLRQTPLYKALEKVTFNQHMGLNNTDRVLNSTETLKQIGNSQPEEILQAVEYLIGRGNGLTPSGDDVLLGFSMIRLAFHPKDDIIEMIKEGLKSRSTTAISQAYYESLFFGYVNSIFLTLIRAVESEEWEETQQMVQLITRYGHTSGYDTLFGFYLGMQSLLYIKES